MSMWIEVVSPEQVSVYAMVLSTAVNLSLPRTQELLISHLGQGNNH